MKKWNVNAVVLNLRGLKEETLAQYDEIKMEAVIALTTPEAQALLAKHNVKLDSILTQNVEDDVSANVVNGKMTLTGANDPAGKQMLVVNGKLVIKPDAGDVLRRYLRIVVNGKVTCPQSLGTVAAGQCVVNGKMATYPDDAVVLGGSSAKLDRFFLLRAQSRLYWHEKQILAVDPALDASALAAKGARFSAPKAILLESLAETLAPCFTDDTELVILPDGTAVVDDDLKLTPAAVRRYGKRLYVAGDVNVPAESADLLEQLEFLHVMGSVLLPEALEEKFCDIPELEYQELRVLKGHIFSGLPMLRVAPDMLELYPEGVACADCAMVTLDEALLPDDIAKKMCFDDCALVRCTARQQNAVSAVSKDVALVKVTDVPEEEDETVSVNGLQMTL